MTSTYRADVDGLRAIAVTFVFLNHFHETLLPSGFVGVDIFFVISGFVVTSSILTGNHGEGVQGLLEFWRRRVLRIFPALLFFVVISSLFFASFFSVNTNVQFISTLRTGIAALAGASNLYLTHISSNYFLADQSVNVFSHTWSLGVEEQFYVVFALIMFLLPILVRRKQKSMLFVMVLMLSATSLLLFIFQIESRPISSYYGLHTRFWELGAGALIAIALLSDKQLDSRKSLSQIMGILGAALVITSAIVGKDLKYGIISPVLFSVLGSGLIIVSGALSTTAISRFLGHSTLVFIGLLSYSIYLFHWPVITFFRWNVGTGATAFFISSLITFLLASFSYRFIETPTRSMKVPLLSRVLPTFGVITATVSGILFSLSANQGSLHVGKSFNQNMWLPPINATYSAGGRISAKACLLTAGDIIPESIPNACFTKQNGQDRSRTVFLIGDSHAYSMFGMVAALETYEGFDGITMVHDGCSINYIQNEDSSCFQYQSTVPRLITQSLGKGDFLLISAHFPLASTFDEVATYRFISTISKAASSVGARVIIEMPHIRLSRSSIHCRREWFRFQYNGCSRSIKTMGKVRENTLETILKIAEKLHDKPLLWDPLPHLCDSEVCRAVTDQGPVLRDQNHISAFAADKLAPAFVKFISGIKG